MMYKYAVANVAGFSYFVATCEIVSKVQFKPQEFCQHLEHKISLATTFYIRMISPRCILFVDEARCGSTVETQVSLIQASAKSRRWQTEQTIYLYTAAILSNTGIYVSVYASLAYIAGGKDRRNCFSQSLNFVQIWRSLSELSVQVFSHSEKKKLFGQDLICAGIEWLHECSKVTLWQQ